MVYVVMGVSGCGKTSVGQELAAGLGVPFHDADAFHPPANVAKMKNGTPLTDADRAPWLAALAAHISEWNRGGDAVLACSALKQRYRDVLRGAAPAAVTFVHLRGSKELILARMQTRQGHFMPPALLDSQFAALEEPQDAITVGIEGTSAETARQVLAILRSRPA